ncbi:MAG: NADH-quinone oxidoreductase subunit J [Rhodocyclaceae bacterium]|nr:NADH-quinone oxidoreductase subunit J [Rhodocyclaceae bacterium]
METTFYVAGAVAIVATAMVVVSTRAVHALLYLILSLLAVALLFYPLGAPFAALLEVIIYAGAIMVLFVFVSMMLNLGDAAARQERRWMQAVAWTGPAVLAAILFVELLVMLRQNAVATAATAVAARGVGLALFGPYLLGVELGSLLLLAGLVGAWHLGRHGAAER